MSNKAFKNQRKQTQLAVSFLVVFSLSVLFPVIAAFRNVEGKVLPVAGIADVTVAFLSFTLFIALTANTNKEKVRLSRGKAYTTTAYASSLLLLFILLYFMGIRVNWEILLIGLGWRYWLLVTALPYLIAAFQKNETNTVALQ